MFAVLGGVTDIKNGITTAVKFCKQKGKNDTELEKQAATLQANLDTLYNFEDKLKNRFEKLDAEDKKNVGT